MPIWDFHYLDYMQILNYSDQGLATHSFANLDA